MFFLLASYISPMAREIWVQSQVESYQRLKKWYLMLSCLTLSIIRYVSRVRWSNPGKGVAPSPTLRCSSYRKGSLRVTLDYVANFTYIYRFVALVFYTGCGRNYSQNFMSSTSEFRLLSSSFIQLMPFWF